MTMSTVVIFQMFDFEVVQCRLSNLRKRCIALSNLRVKGPTVCCGGTERGSAWRVLPLAGRGLPLGGRGLPHRRVGGGPDVPMVR